MMRFGLLLALSVTCAAEIVAQVTAYEIDPSFESGLLFNRGTISDVLMNQQGAYVIMGMFQSNNDSPVHKSALISNAGDLIHAANFAGAKVYNYLDGYLQYGSDLNRFDIPGGGLYDIFKFEFKKPAYIGPLSNVAYDAIVLPDDHILVAGRFFTDSTLMGTPESHLGLRQLCMVDSTGAAVDDFPMIRCAEPVNAYISSLRKLSTGEYIVSGTFNEIDGHYSPKIAKLNPDFSVNTGFESPFLPVGGSVGVAYIDSQDRIWLAYDFNVTFADAPDYPARLARILPSGALDDNYTVPVFTTYLGPDPDNLSDPSNASAYVLEDDDGTFILGGSFIEVNGEPHNRLIKVTDDGTVIEGAFEGLGPDEAAWGNWTPMWPIASARVSVLRKLPDGKLLLGGQFSSFGGEPYSCLVRLQPSGFVGTDDKEGRGVLKVYPNPARQHFRIEMPEGLEPMQQVELSDLQGRTLRTWPATQGPYPVDGLPAGMYVVRASGRDGVLTQKLILER